MLPNYKHTVIMNFSTVSQHTDDNIFINIHTELPPLIPIQSPHLDFEYLRLIKQLNLEYKQSVLYENIQYLIGTIISLYGIYYFVSKSIVSICKKYI